MWPGLVLFTLGSALFLAVAVWNTPRLADGAAYLAGAGGTDYFVAQASAQTCDKTGCHPYTTGILEHRGTSVHWPGAVAPGSRFPVRAPVWPAGEGRTIISGTGDALGAIAQGLLLYLLGAGFAVAFARVARSMTASRRRIPLQCWDAGGAPARTRHPLFTTPQVTASLHDFAVSLWATLTGQFQ